MTEAVSFRERLGALVRSAEERAAAPVDASALAAFRILFGAMVALGALRFLMNGWVDSVYLAPSFHFTYWGFGWVRPLPGMGMHLLFGTLAALGALVALGLFYRVAIVALFLSFTYAELVDVTVYLNHYYLVSLLAFLLCFLPANAAWSLDARRDPRGARPTVPRISLWLLRFQVGTVYFFAGLAKLGPDWLVDAQPLNIWLGSQQDFPLLGPLFGHPETALVVSWAGFLFDTTIPLWLSLGRTRLLAYAAVIAFHSLTGALFPIGLFPLIMTTSALVFFPPDWPRRLLRVPAAAPELVAARVRPRLARAWTFAGVFYLAVQVLVPLRHHLYEGNVLWHEQGMRWAWKVMVREKNGSVTYVARSPATGRVLHVSPRRYLTSLQESEMATQPDLILRLAHHIRDDLRARGLHDVQIYADSIVSLNGRPARRLVDLAVDLARVQDGLAPFYWVLPGPTEQPPTLQHRDRAARLGTKRDPSS